MITRLVYEHVIRNCHINNYCSTMCTVPPPRAYRAARGGGTVVDVESAAILNSEIELKNC